MVSRFAELSRHHFCWTDGRRAPNNAQLSPQLHLRFKYHLLSISQIQTPLIGPGARRHTTCERVRIRHLCVHMQAFSVHITNLQQTCCCSLPVQMFGCRSFSRSSSGIRRDKQNTSSLRCNSREEIPALRFQGVQCLLSSIHRTFCYMSGACKCSSYHHLLRLKYLFAV